MKRFGMVLGVKPEKIDEYKRLHAAVWPDVLKMITACNIRNYSIFLKDDRLFSYFEYTGDDYEADMNKMAEDPQTRNGGMWSSPSRNHWNHVPMENGGQRWKRYFIADKLELHIYDRTRSESSTRRYHPYFRWRFCFHMLCPL